MNMLLFYRFYDFFTFIASYVRIHSHKHKANTILIELKPPRLQILTHYLQHRYIQVLHANNIGKKRSERNRKIRMLRNPLVQLVVVFYNSVSFYFTTKPLETFFYFFDEMVDGTVFQFIVSGQDTNSHSVAPLSSFILLISAFFSRSCTKSDEIISSLRKRYIRLDDEGAISRLYG